MVRPNEFHGSIIQKAFENGDKKTVIEAYIDTLNYDHLNRDHIIKVYESQVFEDAIDHGLISHLNKLVEKKGL